ncbi:MAG: isochorismatase family cysteine hydrolase [Sulfuricellaceae bacterium]|nr:isochorismatase family cysteine hydrolase [Sulfuricellaceae bacterium]
MSGSIKIGDGDALLVIDVQNDFLNGGRAPLIGGDQVVSALRYCTDLFQQRGHPIFALRRLSDAEHAAGAEAPVELGLPAFAMFISRAAEADGGAHSGFEGSNLEFQLMMYGIKRLFVGGLFAETAMLETIRDARQKGLAICLMRDAQCAVDSRKGEQALQEMLGLGVQMVDSSEVV